MKLRSISTAIAAVATMAAAVAVGRPKPGLEYALVVTTDRKTHQYHRGEPVTFTITLTDHGTPVDGAEVKWQLTKDGLTPPLKQGTLTLAKGSATVTGSLDEPGFLQCRADYKSDKESVPTGRAGAAIDPLDIKPSMPAPDDFDAFWADQKKLLAAVPMNVRMTPVKSPEEGVECFDVQADCIGAPMSGYLARPISAKPGTLPAIVLCHGSGVASSRLSVAAGWGKDGFVALDFNAHGLPNGMPTTYYSSLYQGDLKQYYLKGRDSRDTIFFRSLFIRLMRAMDVLMAQPEWNGKQFVAYGRSQGGGQAIAAAALNPHVTFIAAQIPILCDNTGVTIGRIDGWPKLAVIDENGKVDEKSFQASRYFDCCNFIARTHADAFFTLGFIDQSCPPTGVYAVYNLASGQKQILQHLRQGHVATDAADEAVRSAVLSEIAGKFATSQPASESSLPW